MIKAFSTNDERCPFDEILKIPCYEWPEDPGLELPRPLESCQAPPIQLPPLDPVDLSTLDLPDLLCPSFPIGTHSSTIVWIDPDVDEEENPSLGTTQLVISGTTGCGFGIGSLVTTIPRARIRPGWMIDDPGGSHVSYEEKAEIECVTPEQIELRLKIEPTQVNDWVFRLYAKLPCSYTRMARIVTGPTCNPEACADLVDEQGQPFVTQPGVGVARFYDTNLSGCFVPGDAVPYYSRLPVQPGQFVPLTWNGQAWLALHEEPNYVVILEGDIPAASRSNDGHSWNLGVQNAWVWYRDQAGETGFSQNPSYDPANSDLVARRTCDGECVRRRVYNCYDKRYAGCVPQLAIGNEAGDLYIVPGTLAESDPSHPSQTSTTSTTPMATCLGRCKHFWHNSGHIWIPDPENNDCRETSTTSTTGGSTSSSTSSTTSGLPPCHCTSSSSSSTSSTSTSGVDHGRCNCTYPTFCGTEEGECTYTYCSPLIVDPADRVDCYPSSTSSTTSTTCACNDDLCKYVCLQRNDGTTFWDPVPGTECGPGCVCEEPEEPCIPCKGGNGKPVLIGGGGGSGCWGICYWNYVPGLSKYFLVNAEGGCGDNPNICPCVEPSYPPSDEQIADSLNCNFGNCCIVVTGPCGKPPAGSSSSTTGGGGGGDPIVGPCGPCYGSTSSTTSTTGDCPGSCRWKSDAEIEDWDPHPDSEGCGDCACDKPPHAPEAACDTAVTVCHRRTTTTSTTSTTGCYEGYVCLPADSFFTCAYSSCWDGSTVVYPTLIECETDVSGNCRTTTTTGVPTGACCISSLCGVLTAVACGNAAGVYQGNGTTCSPNPCSSTTTTTPAPTGACCYNGPLFDTICGVMTAEECAEQDGGSYGGNGTDCLGDICGDASTTTTTTSTTGGDGSYNCVSTSCVGAVSGTYPNLPACEASCGGSSSTSTTTGGGACAGCTCESQLGGGWIVISGCVGTGECACQCPDVPATPGETLSGTCVDGSGGGGTCFGCFNTGVVLQCQAGPCSDPSFPHLTLGACQGSCIDA